MAAKLKTSGKLVIGLIVFGLIFGLKVLWWDKRPHDVEASQTFGKVSIPDAPEASLSGTAAVKLKLPSDAPAFNGGTKVQWYMMAWQAQNSIGYSTGGVRTTKGSLFDQSKIDMELVHQDDCNKSCAAFENFCKAYKDDPKTPGVFVTFMGSGIPQYITHLSEALKNLPPEYQPIGFLISGKSYGEDQILGDRKYKDNKQNLKGAVLIGVRMDGDNDLALKLSGDNNINVNSSGTTYDPDALNLIYPNVDFLESANIYATSTMVSLHIVKNGKTTGRDTTVAPDLVATWTPGDVNAYEKRGGVTIISTKDYASIMPAVTFTCKKWLNDHRDVAVEITKDLAIAGDQIRSFEDVKQWTCGLNTQIYTDSGATKTKDFWYKYYKGVQITPDTHLGGSMVFNLADMANILGIATSGQTETNDIYQSVYNTFGTLQSKYYKTDLPTYLPYNKAFDKSILMQVISENPDLLKGKLNVSVDYKNTSMTKSIGNKSYHITFTSGSAQIADESTSVLNEIYQSIVTADGTKASITGYTDNVGNPAQNVELSKQRAVSVLNYLHSKGISTDRLSSQGLGDANPIGDNSTSTGKAQNRRVEIAILGK